MLESTYVDEFENELKNRAMELDKIIKKAQSYLEKTPEGMIRVSMRNENSQYYLRTDTKDKNGVYLGKSNLKLAMQLSQKEYAQKVLQKASKIHNNMIKLLKNYETDPVQKVYEKMPVGKQKLITPYIFPDEQYINMWLDYKLSEREKIRQSKAAFKDNKTTEFEEILTERGEYVRSKSEKILADKFYLMNIPYIYEQPLHMNGYGYIKPDFTIINRRTRKEYIWEHLGMMDDPKYARKAVMKIELFEKNEMYPGRELILTYETSEHPLNIKIAEDLIRKYLI